MESIINAFKHMLTLPAEEAKNELGILIKLDKEIPITFLVHPEKTDFQEIENKMDALLSKYVVLKLGKGLTKEEIDFITKNRTAFGAILVSNICLGSLMLEQIQKKHPKPTKKEGEEDNG